MEEARNENSVVTDLLCVDVIFQHLICGIPNLLSYINNQQGTESYRCLLQQPMAVFKLIDEASGIYTVSYTRLTQCLPPLGS